VRLLVVEDEADLASELAGSLRRAGFAVDVALDGEGALERLATNDYDLVTLDVNLPDVDGWEIVRQVRSTERPTRVLMVTARDGLDDRVRGLDSGADDYLLKPFYPAELLARVRALLRRDTTHAGAVMRVGDLELDSARLVGTRRARPLDLTPKEFAVLRYLMARPGEVVSGEELLEHVWDEQADPFTATVKVTVMNLRRKLGEDQPIETIRGAGYRLRSGMNDGASMNDGAARESE
jgi:DNA-binding response OmpR family regulator